MADTSLTLTVEEREYLSGLLETVLKDTQIEEHRTRAPAYRQHVLHQEALIDAILKKLKTPG